MHRFWDTVLGPLCGILEPRSIVEIGAGRGFNSRNIIEYCRRSGARCHVIDPAPAGDLEELASGAAELVELHCVPSLEVLGRLDGDLFLIDGDHNWHTVSGELRAIEARGERRPDPLPVVCLHDVGWPYGRRDLYYAPERIPEPERQPHARRGIALGEVELAASGGYNSRHCNALREGGPRNGVLTAVEDFVAERLSRWRFDVVPGFHGLAVLWSPASLGEDSSRRIESLLDSRETLRRHLESLERSRLELLVYCREMERLVWGWPGRVGSWVARATRLLGL